MLKIKRILVGILESCCYIVNEEKHGNAMIIDPGADADMIVQYCRDNNLTPTLIVNTHGHGDHIGANKELKELFPGIEINIHADDEPMLTNEYLNLSLLAGKRYKSPPADRVLLDNDEILFGNIRFRVIHVPGHTVGGICLLYVPPKCDINSYCNGIGESDIQPVLFSGDTLFNGGIGGTNFPKSDFQMLVDAIKNRLFTLDDDTIVYPGHGEVTTILKERGENTFVSLQQV